MPEILKWLRLIKVDQDKAKCNLSAEAVAQGMVAQVDLEELLI